MRSTSATPSVHVVLKYDDLRQRIMAADMVEDKFYSIYQRQRFQVACVRSILLRLFYYMFLNLWDIYTETIDGP